LKRKLLSLSLITALFVLQLIQFSTSPQNLIVSGSDFAIEFSTGEALALQGDDTLQIEVLEGVLNSSSNYILMYDRRGEFRFVALNDSTLEVSSPDAEAGFDIEILGANQTTRTDRFTFQSVIKSGDTVRILWNWRIEDWISKYTMLSIGIGGLVLMVASPTWGVWVIRKKGLDPDSIERVMYAFLLFCVGFGLLVMWLWS